jgi:hypothetical protein
MFVNDPGYATQNPELFNGNAMTYYGRWTYKFEEAARPKPQFVGIDIQGVIDVSPKLSTGFFTAGRGTTR